MHVKSQDPIIIGIDGSLESLVLLHLVIELYLPTSRYRQDMSITAVYVNPKEGNSLLLEFLTSYFQNTLPSSSSFTFRVVTPKGDECIETTLTDFALASCAKIVLLALCADLVATKMMLSLCMNTSETLKKLTTSSYPVSNILFGHPLRNILQADVKIYATYHRIIHYEHESIHIQKDLLYEETSSFVKDLQQQSRNMVPNIIRTCAKLNISID